MRKKIEGRGFFIANCQILTKDYKDKFIDYVYLYKLIVDHKISNVFFFMLTLNICSPLNHLDLSVTFSNSSNI